jgi:predicted nucleic acid-binding protein
MATLVADTSGLVSLGVAADHDPDPLALCLDRHEVTVPEVVVEELRTTAAHDDAHGRAATAVLDRSDSFGVRSVSLDGEFPLDDGENAAVTLANDTGVSLLLCDEFNSLGLVHASLADTRLVTTLTLLAAFVRGGTLTSEAALTILETISRTRSWDGNSYVERARSLLDP